MRSLGIRGPSMSRRRSIYRVRGSESSAPRRDLVLLASAMWTAWAAPGLAQTAGGAAAGDERMQATSSGGSMRLQEGDVAFIRFFDAEEREVQDPSDARSLTVYIAPTSGEPQTVRLSVPSRRIADVTPLTSSLGRAGLPPFMLVGPGEGEIRWSKRSSPSPLKQPGVLVGVIYGAAISLPVCVVVFLIARAESARASREREELRHKLEALRHEFDDLTKRAEKSGRYADRVNEWAKDVREAPD